MGVTAGQGTVKWTVEVPTELSIAAAKQIRLRGMSKNKLLRSLMTAWLADLDLVPRGEDPLDEIDLSNTGALHGARAS